jgi:hypothetical protein
MKPWIVSVLAGVVLTHHVRASGATMIDISTTDEGVSYAMHDYNYRTELSFQRAEELEAWMQKHYAEDKQKGPGVWLRPDDRTTFKTVFDLMLRFKGTNLEVMLLEGKVGNDRMVATWRLEEFKVNKMAPDKPEKVK